MDRNIKSNMMHSVVVTGVSTGIGYSIAKKLIAHDIFVFGSVRSEVDAKRLKKELGHLFMPLIFDVTDEEAVKQAALTVKEELKGNHLWGLINNAGIAVASPILEVSIEDFRYQLEVNLVGQLIVTQAFAPLLMNEKATHQVCNKIINIGSIMGKYVSPFLGPYATSKHGLEALTDTMRLEFMKYDIDVVLVGPGMVDTPIWDKSSSRISDETIDKSSYSGAINKFKNYIFKQVSEKSMPTDKVSEVVYQALISKHPKTRYAVVSNRLLDWIVPLSLPKHFLNKKIGKFLGLLPKKTK